MTAPSVVMSLLAGLASFLSPCVLPLVPAYIGYLTGQAVGATRARPSLAARFSTFLHALAFVIGFSAVFMLMGLAAGGIGWLLRADWVRWIGGLLMLFFGLALTGLIRLPFLEGEHRVQAHRRPELGYLSSVLIGVAFAGGWTPCVGPILGAILALGASQGTVLRAVLLLAAYSVGLGLPFLLVGLAVDRAGVLLRRLTRYLRPIQVAFGVLMVLLGGLLLTGWLQTLAQWLGRLGLGWDFGL